MPLQVSSPSVKKRMYLGLQAKRGSFCCACVSQPPVLQAPLDEVLLQYQPRKFASDAPIGVEPVASSGRSAAFLSRR